MDWSGRINNAHWLVHALCLLLSFAGRNVYVVMYTRINVVYLVLNFAPLVHVLLFIFHLLERTSVKRARRGKASELIHCSDQGEKGSLIGIDCQ